MTKALSWLIKGSTLFCLLPWWEPIAAQIVPDATLRVNSSVTREGNNTSAITGGTQVGSNLFHSFGQFSVPTGSAVYFNIKYLTQALCIPELEEKCSSAPPLYSLALEKLFSPNLIPMDCDLDKGKRENVELIDSDSLNPKTSTQKPKKSFHFPHIGLVVLWSDMGTGKTQLMR